MFERAIPQLFSRGPPAEDGSRRATRWSSAWGHRFLVVAVAALGILLAAAACVFAWRWEDQLERQRFTSIGENHVLALQNGLNEYLNKLLALRALFQSSVGDVTRQEFELFAGSLLRSDAAIQNLSWIPRIAAADRARYEAAAEADEFPNFHITAVLADGHIGLSPPKNEYLPIYYSTLSDRTSPIYGLDVASQAFIRTRLDRARDTDSLACVPDLLLHSIAGEVHGILISLPVYRQGVSLDTRDDRRRQLTGYVHGSFRTAEMVTKIVDSATAAQGVDLYLFASDAKAGDAPLAFHPSRWRTAPSAPHPLQAVLASGLHWSGQIRAGEASWRVIVVPADSVGVHHHDRAWIVLLAGLMITAMIVGYMLTTYRHARRLLRATQQMTDMAQHDAMTGLANRRAFLDQLGLSFNRCKRGDGRFAVLYFDIDHFKDVNDTLGHPIGDLLLREVARRVAEEVRTTDVVARFGGDEFAVLQAHSSDTAAAAKLAVRITTAIGRPFAIDGNQIHITASLGIAVFSDEVDEAEAMMMQADLALYRAKEEGRNCFRFHTFDLDRQIRERVSTADDLRLAMDNGDLELHYQPQVELATGRIVGLEALLRWRHPRRGYISPAFFIPIAERAGLIIPLGQWVFDQACRQRRAWQDQGLQLETLAVNFSALQLKGTSDICQEIAATLDKWGVAAAQMEVELTETVLMEITQQHSAVLEDLRRLGIRIAMDDFGTGYSSLSYLASYPVNRLKIAQQLISKAPTDPRSATVVQAAIRLAGDLGIQCIAEGVETMAHVKFLRTTACAYVQGYCYSRPVSAAQATALLRQGTLQPAKPVLSLVASQVAETADCAVAG
jgi:diguanylate cyclase (GGDEF)-like protein